MEGSNVSRGFYGVVDRGGCLSAVTICKVGQFLTGTINTKYVDIKGPARGFGNSGTLVIITTYEVWVEVPSNS